MNQARPASNIVAPSGSGVSERIADRTENSRTYNLTADGRKRRHIVARSPIHYRDEAGVFQEIDLSVDISGATNNLDAAPYRLEIPKNDIGFISIFPIISPNLKSRLFPISNDGRKIKSD